MIIFSAKVNSATALAVCRDGLGDHLNAVHFARSFDNQSPGSFPGLPSIDVGNHGTIIAAKHRFELSKYLKTNGNNQVTSIGAIAVTKGSYYGDVSGMVKRGIAKKMSGLFAIKNNIKTMVTGDGVLMSTAGVKHTLTAEGAANGFFIMVFPAVWLFGQAHNNNVFMLPNNAISFDTLASMAGPSFKGIKDQSGKSETIDWFHTQKRRNIEATRYAKELTDRQDGLI